MSRRRLRIISDDDEDSDHRTPTPPPPPRHQSTNIDIDLQQTFQSVSLNPQNPNPNLSPDYLSPENLSPDYLSPENLSPHNISPPLPMDQSGYFEPLDCPIALFLANLGLRLRSDWVDSCVRGLEGSVTGFRNLDVGLKAKMCFERFLCSDMNRVGTGVLPENVSGLHLVDLAGPFVLQVDEIVSMSCPLKGRYQAANPGLKRCLKLSMTDGIQRVFGMEYRPIKDLEVLAPAGLKVLLRNVHVRRGMLMLVPEVIEILGGQVEDLEAARQRLVQEVNKPPRGKRTRNGVVPPLATRATNAAWPPNDLSASGTTNATTSQATAPRVAEPASTQSFFTRERNPQEFAVPNNIPNMQPSTSTPLEDRTNYEPNFPSGVENSRGIFDSNISPPVGIRRANIPSNISTPVGNRTNLEPTLSSGVKNSRGNFDSNKSTPVGNRSADVQSNMSTTVGNRSVDIEPNLSSGAENSRDNFDSNILPPFGNRRANLGPNRSSGIEYNRDNFDLILPSAQENRRASVESNFSSTAGISRSNFESHVSSTMASVETNLSSTDGNSYTFEPNLSDTFIPDAEDVHMTDEVDHPSILTGYPEFPFTYIASLSAKLTKDKASFVQGTIKCFLTGVKGFQFKHKEKYELHAYVDDGSLISEILIDHTLVQKIVGYSPQEVTAILTSSDTKRVNEMKEIMRQFQFFLLNFEGTMLIQMSEGSPFPTATEMNQGCTTSAAWLLLKRLETFNANQPQQQRSSIEPIDLSP